MSRGNAVEDIKEFAHLLLVVLRNGRSNDTVNPTRPLSSSEIIKRYEAKYGSEIVEGDRMQIVDVHVRQAIHYLCAELGESIVSLSGRDGGYFYALTPEEYRAGNAHLLSRLSEISAHYYGPLKRFEREVTREMQFQENL